MTDRRVVAVASRLRRRVGWLDHLVRAGLRYDEADGGRLAAAVTYYSFFATFSLGLLAFAVFGSSWTTRRCCVRCSATRRTTFPTLTCRRCATPGTTPARWLLATVGLLLSLGVNAVLAAGVLTGLPRLRMPLRRVVGPALLVSVALELLKTLGRLYVQRTAANPTYHLVAGSVGLLVFLNAINQVVLFAAALTATSRAGRPADLSAGRPDYVSSRVDDE